MEINSKEKIIYNWKRIGMHFLFWSVSLSFFWILFSRSSGDILNTALFISVLSPIAIFITYFFNYRLIPKFLIKGDYFRFVWFGTIAAISGLWLILMVGIFIWAWRAEFYFDKISYSTLDVPMLTTSLFFVVLSGVSIKLIRTNLIVQYQKEQAEKARLLADNQLKVNELKLLKDQLNPHFLFNTLNNLYGLTLEKSDKAPDLVMRLSNMLDYMLYRTNTEFVSLQQEIEMINNYVAIEKHRFEGKYNLSFNIEGNHEYLSIAPLLLLPLVENCFKHGVRKSIKHPIVKIDLKITNSVLQFNTLNTHADEQMNVEGGIGLKNLRQRLEGIYPKNFSLDIFEEPNKFITQLHIQLTSK